MKHSKTAAPSTRANRAMWGLGLLALVGASAFAAETASDPASYTWSAELVTFDKATNTVTVKARLVEEAPSVDAGWKPGESAMLAWSGLSDAAGVRGLEHGSKTSFDRMTMPVQYVGSEGSGRYVSFKVQIPASGAAAIANLKPGAYVTATSPERATDPKTAVTSIRPYSKDTK